MASVKLSEIIVDATNLEISSILVDGITGRKMPGIVPALLETISAWVFQFEVLKNQLIKDRFDLSQSDCKNIVKATKNWSHGKDTLFHDYSINKGEFTHFSKNSLVTDVLSIEAMRTFRKAMMEQTNRKPNADDHNAELFRLLKVQTRLYVLLKQLEETPQKNQINDATKGYDVRHMQELRKLWELKDGYIYAQSVVQLDGDIIARNNLRIYRDRRVRDNAMQLLDFHRKNVDIGIKHWHFIIETIVSIAGAVHEKLVNLFK